MVGSCCFVDIAKPRAGCDRGGRSDCLDVVALRLKHRRDRAMVVVNMEPGFDVAWLSIKLVSRQYGFTV